MEGSCKRNGKTFADRDGTRIVRSKGQLTASYHKKARLKMLQRVSTLQIFFQPVLGMEQGDQIRDSRGKQVHCGQHQIRKSL